MYQDSGITSNDIFKNYYNILNNPEHDFQNPNTFLAILGDDSKYNWFKSSLCQGMNEDQIQVANIFCDAQRTFLLEDMANIINGDTAIGYAISYFPILCDTYCTDILGNAILYKSVSKPIFTVPRMKMLATVNNSDGSVSNWTFPRAYFLIRTKSEKLLVFPGKTNTLFTLSNSYPHRVNENVSKLNKRYFNLESINIQITNLETNEAVIITQPLSIRADSRSQLNSDFEIISENIPGLTAHCSLIGHVNFDKGLLQFNMTSNSSNPNYKFEAVSGIASCVFNAKTNDVGRVKVSVKMSGLDLNIDITEDFQYELDSESIQEYTDIYNVDLIKTISIAIKGQILLNRDLDIAHLLETAIPDMKLNHTYEEQYFEPIYDTNGLLSPGFFSSIYQNIIPKISLISRYMYCNSNSIPTHMLCGIRASALLESLQEFVVTMPQMRSGMGGFNSNYGSSIHKNAFRGYNILMSHAIPEDRIYLVYKPGSREEEIYTNLINFVYKPLYIIEEITDSQKRTFIRSRTSVEMLNTSTLGCVYMPDLVKTMFTYESKIPEVNWF